MDATNEHFHASAARYPTRREEYAVEPSSSRSFDDDHENGAAFGGNGAAMPPNGHERWEDADARDEVTADRPMAWLQSIFTSFAGMDPHIMNECPRHERSATWKLGLTLLIPVSLAMIAGNYTITTLTGSYTIGLVCGLAWAAAIFSIDLAVMATLTHATSGPLGSIHRNTIPSRLSAWLRGLFGGDSMPATMRRFALLRILMALVLGAVMSHTLVMGIFNQRIFAEIEADRRKELATVDEAWRQRESELLGQKPVYAAWSDPALDSGVTDKEKTLTDLQGELRGYRNELDALDGQIGEKERARASEYLGGNSSGKGPGRGPYYEAMTQELELLNQKRAALLARIEDTSHDVDGARKAVDQAQANRDRQLEQGKTARENQHTKALQAWKDQYDRAEGDHVRRRSEIATELRSDLLYQTEYFHRIVTSHLSTLIWALGIFAAVFILDLIPLLLKFYRRPGVYDAWVADDERRMIHALQERRRPRDAVAA